MPGSNSRESVGLLDRRRQLVPQRQVLGAFGVVHDPARGGRQPGPPGFHALTLRRGDGDEAPPHPRLQRRGAGGVQHDAAVRSGPKTHRQVGLGGQHAQPQHHGGGGQQAQHQQAAASITGGATAGATVRARQVRPVGVYRGVSGASGGMRGGMLGGLVGWDGNGGHRQASANAVRPSDQALLGGQHGRLGAA